MGVGTESEDKLGSAEGAPGTGMVVGLIVANNARTSKT